MSDPTPQQGETVAEGHERASAQDLVTQVLASKAIREQRDAVARQGRRQKTLIWILCIFTAVNLAIFVLQIGLGAAFNDVQNVVDRQEVGAAYSRATSAASRCVSGAQSGALLALSNDLAVVNSLFTDPAARVALADPNSPESKRVAEAQQVLNKAQPTLKSIFNDSQKPANKRTGGDCPLVPIPKTLQQDDPTTTSGG